MASRRNDPLTTPFLEVPTDVWLDMRMLPVMPRFVRVPRYPASRYDSVGVVDNPRLDGLRAFAGEAVRVVQKSHTEPELAGALIAGEDRAFVCSLTERTKSAARLDIDRVVSVARLVKRPPMPSDAPALCYATVVRSIQHRAAVVRVDGAVIDYELSLDPRPRRPGIASATDVLQLLARPIEDRNRWGFVGDSPLAASLRQGVPVRVIRNLDELYRITATKYIRSYELGVPDPIAMPDLDSLPLEALHEALERRVLATLRVTTTDPRWTEHLASAPEWLHLDERTLPLPE